MRTFRCFLACLAITFCMTAGAWESRTFEWTSGFDEVSDLTKWQMTDETAWRLAEGKSGKGLELFRQSNYKPKVRSPVNYALLKEISVGDFVLDVDVKSTARDYGHRDLCLFFGHQDAEHFYYVHLGKSADPAAHSIFLVNGKPRVSIASERTKGTPWTNGWHHVRVRRELASGKIEVYFDDMEKPIMLAIDKTFGAGKIGVGSFDDTGVFDNLTIKGSAP